MIIGGTGAFNQTSPSSVTAQGIAEEMLAYPNGEIGGINYIDPISGAHVIYFAFGLEAVSGLGNTNTSEELLIDIFQWSGIPSSVEPGGAEDIPTAFKFHGCTPNPFNSSTEIKFTLPAGFQLKIAAYNLLGQEIAVLGEGYYSAGLNSLRWDAEGLSSGIYLISIFGENINASIKTLLLK